MTHKKSTPALLGKTSIVIIVILLFLTGTATAGSIFIDTAGLTGKVGETTQVPVKVTGANQLYSLGLQCGIGETADYKIAFNTASMTRFIYNPENGMIAQIALGISGDQVLFYLDVTPKKAVSIPLTLTLTTTREGTNGNVNDAQYTSSGATLTVEGSSTQTPAPTPSTPVTPPSSATSTPSTIITPTATPSPSATATPTQTETVPTGSAPTDTVPTLPPAATDTPAKSPVPLLGLLAGFGIALCIARRP